MTLPFARPFTAPTCSPLTRPCARTEQTSVFPFGQGTQYPVEQGSAACVKSGGEQGLTRLFDEPMDARVDMLGCPARFERGQGSIQRSEARAWISQGRPDRPHGVGRAELQCSRNEWSTFAR